MAILKKTESNTLVEVLVAAVIVSVLLSISTMIILNLSRNNTLLFLNRDINELNKTFYLRSYSNKLLKEEIDEKIELKLKKDSFEILLETKSEEQIIRYGTQK